MQYGARAHPKRLINIKRSFAWGAMIGLWNPRVRRSLPAAFRWEIAMAEGPTGFGAIQDYAVDAWQRSILLLDTLRERGDNYVERASQEAPHVLSFPAELIRDGRTLERPVNYLLVRIIPPAGIEIDQAKPPIVVVDP